MLAEPLAIRGAVLLRPPHVQADERGSFRRVVDVAELAALGLDPGIDQVSVATNLLRGTVRGMHYQVPPHTESKTLWCTAGSVFDVLVDLRPDEPTYGSWIGVTLSGDEPCALHVPPGVAHGYQTLVDGSDLTYLISAAYHPASARSLSWADATVGIDWPLPVTMISDRDREAPLWPPSP
jgi:dTDP-4-dehydrorhamnose 3,5-epimerase